MKATEARFLNFLRKSPQFIIPIYQRSYSWTEKECRQLWDDIIRTGSNDDVSHHFVGSVVYIEQGLSQVTDQAPLLVIDGQQRLTTLTLILAALLEQIGEEEPIEGFSASKLRYYYLLNREETGERHYKLLLSKTDKDTLISVVADTAHPKEFSRRVVENFELFRSLIAEHKDDVSPICKGLAKLLMVDVALTRGQDNPQLIFESMNSTGRELSQADLIRNFILMGLEPDQQTRLYNEYWRPLEEEFGQEACDTLFDGFMRHYLTVKTGDIPRLKDVYEAFKTYARSPEPTDAGVEALVSDIRTFGGYYCAMALNSEPDPKLRLAFHDLRELTVDVAYPFLLELYDDYANGILSSDELLSAVRLVEAYVFRRAICAIPTNSLNKTFSTFGRSLKKDRYLESIQAHFSIMPSYRRFPENDEFRRELMSRDLYNFPRRTYWLRRLENHDRKERVPVDEYTIEHILPQNENLTAAWRDALGPDWREIQERCLHTLGNLTLTGYNSEYSDRPFSEKRDMQGGFRESPLKLNQGLGDLETWDEQAIRARANRLANKAVAVWDTPKLNDDVLAQYRREVVTSNYTINDHPNLDAGITRELYEALRREVLALDPCVTEEFRKHYVAYKAETNFVDVVPQAKRLRLSLNMTFPEIDDPKGICRDITGIGRWGNGFVDVRLTSLEELPYLMGLVRQSFEKQMGQAAEF